MGVGKNGESTIERDIAGLEEMTSQAISLYANNRVNSAINASKDILVSSLAACEHSRLALKETIRGMGQASINHHKYFFLLCNIVQYHYGSIRTLLVSKDSLGYTDLKINVALTPCCWEFVDFTVVFLRNFFCT